ncbi:MAG: hypothetical protein KDD50_05565 [Bdellovibrionales bacterium]|nr:hypothetical protein [Bdellovibrionales bacterium]
MEDFFKDDDYLKKIFSERDLIIETEANTSGPLMSNDKGVASNSRLVKLKEITDLFAQDAKTIDFLNNEIDQLKEEAERLKRENSAYKGLEDKLRESHKQNSLSRQNLETQQMNLKKTLARQKDLYENAKVWQSKWSVLHNQQEQKNEYIEKLSERIKTLEGDLTIRIEEKSKHESILNQMNTQLMASRALIEERNSEIEILNRKAEDQINELSGLKKRFNGREELFKSKAEQAAAQFSLQIKSLQKKHLSQQQEWMNSKSALESSISKLKTELKNHVSYVEFDKLKSQLSEKNQEKEDLLVQMNRDQALHEKKCVELVEKFQSLQSKFLETETYYDLAQKEVDKLKQETQSLQSKSRKLEIDREELDKSFQESLKQRDIELNEMSLELERFRSQSELRLNALEKLKLQLAEKSEQNSQQTRQIAQMSNELSEKNVFIANLESNLRSSKEEHQRRSGELSLQLKAKSDELEVVQKQFAEKLTYEEQKYKIQFNRGLAQEKEIQKLKQDINSQQQTFKGEIESLQEKQESSQSEIHHLEKSLQSTQEQLRASEENAVLINNDHRKEKQDLYQKFEETRRLLELKISQLQSDVEDRQSQVVKEITQKKSLEDSYERLKEELAEEKKQRAFLIQKHNEESLDFESAIEQLRREKESHDQVLALKESKVMSLESRLIELQIKIEEIEKINSENCKTIQSLNKLKLKNIEEIHSLSDTIEGQNHQLKILGEDLEAKRLAHHENQAWRQKEQTYKESLEAQKNHYESLMSESRLNMDQLQKQLDMQKESEVKSLKNISQLEDKLKSYEEQMEALEEKYSVEIDALTAEIDALIVDRG